MAIGNSDRSQTKGFANGTIAAQWGLIAALLAVAVLAIIVALSGQPKKLLPPAPSDSGHFTTAGRATEVALRNYGEDGQPTRATWMGPDGGVWQVEIRPVEAKRK